jgi:membrane protein implicated in regulation of membrane protease activity
VAAVAATIAAAIAAAMATTVATAVATATPVATAMAAVATMATTIAAIATTAAMTKGHRRAITAHEGNTNQREKQRETENNDAIHPKSSNYLQVPVSGHFQIAVNGDHRAATDGTAPRCDLSSRSSHPSGPKWSLL